MLPADGRFRVLRSMEGLGEAKVPLARLDLGWPGCALEGGTGIRRRVNECFTLHMLEKNWPEGMSHYLR